MPIAPITTSGPTITVSTAEELKEAYDLLSNQSGGGSILLEPGSYGGLNLYQYGSVDGDQPVIIASMDPSDPAHFTSINLREAENIRIEGVHVDSTGVDRDEWAVDLLLQNSSNIQIVGSTFIHDPTNEIKESGEPSATMGLIRHSENFVFEDNYVDGYLYGLGFDDTSHFEVVGNEFTNIQGDGIRGGGMQDGLIADNYMHDFYPVNQNVTHSDLIQIWGTNADQITQNVTITGNTLITSDAATQSIFIRSGEFGLDSSETSGYFQNITVTDNLIYNAHLHGVYIHDVDGAVVENNTLIWNPDAEMVMGDNDPISWVPIINLGNAINSTISGNITGGITASDGTVITGNEIVTYSDAGDANYVGLHFVDPFAGVNVTPEDLAVLPSSPWFGTIGASIGNESSDVADGVTAVLVGTSSATDSYDVTFDASNSFSADGPVSEAAGYSFHWTFGDGSTATGVTVSKMYDSGGFKGVELDIRLDGETVAMITRNVAVETKDIFEFDFEGGVVDLSDGAPDIVENGQLVSSDDGTGYRIGDGNKFELGRGTDGLYEMDSFGLSLDLTPTDDETSGIFLHLHETMTGIISEEGYFVFQLITDEGTFDLISREPIFDDGETHRIGIAFDGNSGQLELFSDGESVSSTEAWGTTAPPVYFNLVFGNTWQDSMDAIIDNLEMSADPSTAGVLPEPPVEEPEPPVEEPEPPVEEPEPPVEEPEPPVEEPEPPVEEPEPPVEEPEPPVEEPEPPVEEPEPPVEEPEPPVEEPEPPVEEPEDPGDRGDPREPVENDGNTNFLSELLDMILSLFGLGGDDDEPRTTETAAAQFDTSLDQVVPVIEGPEDEVSEEAGDDEDIFDIAA